MSKFLVKDLDTYNRLHTEPYGQNNTIGFNNNILSKELSIGMDDEITHCNLNTMIVGGPNTGKSEKFIIPNILQTNRSYVVVDHGGKILAQTKNILKRMQYRVKVLDLTSLYNSYGYNPLHYVEEERDAADLADILFSRTDVGWKLFKELAFKFKGNGNFVQIRKALDNYEESEAVGSVKEKLSELSNHGLREILTRDEMDIRSIGDEKEAIFIIPGRSDYLCSMLLSQILTILFRHGEKELPYMLLDEKGFVLAALEKRSDDEIVSKGELTDSQIERMQEAKSIKVVRQHRRKLPIPVQIIAGSDYLFKIPAIALRIEAVRKYNIGCTILAQSLTQLKNQDSEEWEAVVGNCDTFIFFGGGDSFTNEYVANMLTQVSQESKLTAEYLANLDLDECIVIMRGEEAYRDRKYHLEEHPNYNIEE